VTGSPGAISLTAGELYPVAHYVVNKIVDVVSTTLAELSPEVAGDIYDRGIILTGGGALFDRLDDYTRDYTKLAVRIADEPRYAIVRGLAQMFDNPLLLRRAVRSDAVPILDQENEAYSL
jgi:rod shape-determining protein MreB